MIVRSTGERTKTDELMKWNGDLIDRLKGERTKTDGLIRKEWRSDLTDPRTDETTRASTTDDLTNASRSKRKSGSTEWTSPTALSTKTSVLT